MLQHIQRSKLTDPIEKESRCNHSKAPPRVPRISFSDAMPCLPDQEETNQRNKHPMAIIFAADPVAEQKGKAVGIQLPQCDCGEYCAEAY